MKNEKLPVIINMITNENHSINMNRKSMNEIINTTTNKVEIALRIVK